MAVGMADQTAVRKHTRFLRRSRYHLTAAQLFVARHHGPQWGMEHGTPLRHIPKGDSLMQELQHMLLAQSWSICYKSGRSVYEESGPALAIAIMYTDGETFADVYFGGTARLVGAL